jgi:hypothetical protein
MAFRFDAALKDLLKNHPQEWLAVLDQPVSGEVSVLSPDRSAISALADIVLQTGDTLLPVDFQSGPEPVPPTRSVPRSCGS